MWKAIIKYFWDLVTWIFVILRVLNLLEPSDRGQIPVRDYFPILSWSKLARVAGLVMVVLWFLSGQEIDWEAAIAILTWAGGEGFYRFRQAQDQKGTQDVDNPDP